MTSCDYKCPACGNPLKYEQEGEVFTIFCSVGRCPSSAANDGAQAYSLKDAYEELVDIVEQEGEDNE